jgi:hypothetical protein
MRFITLSTRAGLTMKYVVLSVLLLVQLPCFSQKNCLEIYFSPDIAYRRHIDNLINIQTNETPKWGFTTGVIYERKVKERVWINTGIYFTDKGYQTQHLFNVNPGPNSPVSIRFKHNFYQVGIPVNIQYYLTNKNLRFFIYGGLGVSYLIKVMGVTFEQNPNGSETVKRTNLPKENFALFNFSANLGYGIEKDFSPVTIRLFTALNYSFTDTYKNNVFFKMHLYSVGLGLGVYKRFD